MGRLESVALQEASRRCGFCQGSLKVGHRQDPTKDNEERAIARKEEH